MRKRACFSSKRLAPYKVQFGLSLFATSVLYAFDVINPLFQRIPVDDHINCRNSDWGAFLEDNAVHSCT